MVTRWNFSSVFFFSSRRRHTRLVSDWSSDVCSSDLYPELMPERARIQEVVRQEEERFAQTLDVGMEKIEEFFTAQGRQGQGRAIDGKFLFPVSETYGFPRALAEEVLQAAGWRVTDATEVTWKREMDAQRERARAGAAFAAEEGGDGSGLYHRLAADITPVQFVGYETLTSPARILALVDGTDGLRRVTGVAEGAEVEVILDRTPAYAESGGQMGDIGTLVGRNGRGEIVDTYYRGPKLLVHRVRVSSGGFREGEDVAVSVESPRRQGLRQHHPGTHLLHAAPRKVLGSHVAQAGSLVAPDHLRFDFSHGAAVKDRELSQIEELVNEQVQANVEVARQEMDLDEALRPGALALFGEKYGQRVAGNRPRGFCSDICVGTQ